MDGSAHSPKGLTMPASPVASLCCLSKRPANLSRHQCLGYLFFLGYLRKLHPNCVHWIQAFGADSPDAGLQCGWKASQYSR
ncbi:hypothetical protein MPNT_20008 [Candidatus Methylacidithermus pantelleriae]|uniref:Uncharacterized protein n=1 Tax=Candidatus Methylacidithermus pantelleriae TaxID=2744239 RepID=A0A8J2BSL5_9BACT|nr:hypothetical protein MPNT_20008 [Candidatus Methylacidithermus pantelleriae]